MKPKIRLQIQKADLYLHCPHTCLPCWHIFTWHSSLESVLALTVKIRKSQDFLAPISGSPGDQMFSLTFRNSTLIFLNSHLWSKIAIDKLNNTKIHSKFLL